MTRDQHGAPYLRYRNHKMRRDALVPIDVALAGAIAVQQQAVRERFPAATSLLIREKRNFEGRLPYSPDTFRHRLTAWLESCDVRDELGRPVHVTPHQWRHTYATRLKGRGVASDASLPGKREDGAARDTEPCLPTAACSAWRENAGQHGRVGTRLRQTARCGISFCNAA